MHQFDSVRVALAVKRQVPSQILTSIFCKVDTTELVSGRVQPVLRMSVKPMSTPAIMALPCSRLEPSPTLQLLPPPLRLKLLPRTLKAQANILTEAAHPNAQV